MHSEIRAVKDEKSYYQDRLERMARQIDTMGRIRSKCKPMTKKRFHLFNKKGDFGKSRLVETGALRASKEFTEMQRTRKLLKTGQQINKDTSRGQKESFTELIENDESINPLGQGIANDNLHPFSEIEGESDTLQLCIGLLKRVFKKSFWETQI